MQHALVNSQLTPAALDAPTTAACPSCGSPGTYFWRHVQLPREGCRPPNPGTAAGGDDLLRQMRLVRDLIIEGHPDAADGPALVLRSLSVEGAGEPSGLVIPLRQVRHLTAALVDAAVELVAAVVVHHD